MDLGWRERMEGKVVLMLTVEECMRSLALCYMKSSAHVPGPIV